MLYIQWQLSAKPNKKEERLMSNASSGSQTFHEDDRSHKWPTNRTSKQGTYAPGKREQHHSRQRKPMSENPLCLESLPASFLTSGRQGL